MNEAKETRLLLAFVGAMVVIFSLILYIIYRKPVIETNPDITKQLRDSITLLTNQINQEKTYTQRSKEITDSLLSLPPKVKVVYHDQKVFNKSATTKQLDSIARANAGLPPR